MPRDPRRRPFRTRHPAPTAMFMEKPPTVVKRRPAPLHVRHPGPPRIRIRPTTIGVGTPTHTDVVGRPDPAVRRSPEPLSVGGKLVIEEARLRIEWRVACLDWRCSGRQDWRWRFLS